MDDFPLTCLNSREGRCLLLSQSRRTFCLSKKLITDLLFGSFGNLNGHQWTKLHTTSWFDIWETIDEILDALKLPLVLCSKFI